MLPPQDASCATFQRQKIQQLLDQLKEGAGMTEWHSSPLPK
jgi:hypothetical protein